MLEKIKIILVEPKNPGNIGATARAMKTMGLSRLILIKPMQFPHKDAYIRSTHASDILDDCQIADDLSHVIGDCQLVIGTSTRDRGGFIPAINVNEAAKKLVNEVQSSSVALVFGTESHGMTGKDLRLCHYHAYIPTHPDFSSLNLAAAVQTFCYEIYQRFLNDNQLKSDQDDTQESIVEIENTSKFPKHEELSHFYKRFEQSLIKTGFINQKHPGIVMQRLRAVFKRARIDEKELNIFQGIVTSINNKIDD